MPIKKDIVFLALFGMGLLGACGGSGSGSPTPSPVLPPPAVENRPPAFLSESVVSVFEGLSVPFYTVAAQDPDGDPIVLTFNEGVDSAFFDFDAVSQALSFKSPVDFERPIDVDVDNTYEVEFTVSDGQLSARLNLRVTVLDAPQCALPDPDRPVQELPVAKCAESPVMFTRDSQIYDASGVPFLARGINLQYGDSPQRASVALPFMADVGANIVRLQVRRNTTAEQLEEVLDTLLLDPVIIMVAYWEQDTTGGTDFSVLREDVETLWLERWLPVLSQSKYVDRLLLNIVNEWGDSRNNFEDYITAYEQLIPKFRAAGYFSPIVVDAPDFGQNIAGVLGSNGARILGADSLENTILSLHAYNFRFNEAAELDSAFDQMIESQQPWLWGEFGDLMFESSTNNQIDHLELMRQSQEFSIGWIAWSWHGNGVAARILDMSSDYEINLTRRGREIVEGEFGLMVTGVEPNFPTEN